MSDGDAVIELASQDEAEVPMAVSSLTACALSTLHLISCRGRELDLQQELAAASARTQQVAASLLAHLSSVSDNTQDAATRAALESLQNALAASPSSPTLPASSASADLVSSLSLLARFLIKLDDVDVDMEASEPTVVRVPLRGCFQASSPASEAQLSLLHTLCAHCGVLCAHVVTSDGGGGPAGVVLAALLFRTRAGASAAAAGLESLLTASLGGAGGVAVADAPRSGCVVSSCPHHVPHKHHSSHGHHGHHHSPGSPRAHGDAAFSAFIKAAKRFAASPSALGERDVVALASELAQGGPLRGFVPSKEQLGEAHKAQRALGGEHGGAAGRARDAVDRLMEGWRHKAGGAEHEGGGAGAGDMGA